MATEPQPLQNFNTDTMSGIYPGSRTMIYQRLRLAGSEDNRRWVQLRWYASQENGVAGAAALFTTKEEQEAATPTITIADPLHANFIVRLHDELTKAGLQADACYICRHWQPLSVQTVAGLPAGRCRWNDVSAALPSAL